MNQTIWLQQEKLCVIVYEVREGKSGNCYVVKTVMIRSMKTLAAISFRACVVLETTNKTKENLDCSRKNFDALNCCACAKRHTAFTNLSNKFIFSDKGQNKQTLEVSGDRLMAKSRKVLDETVNVKSVNRGFCTTNHLVATFGQTKKGLFCFYRKQVVESDGIHTLPLKF